MFDYVFRFPSSDRAKAVLSDLWGGEGWQPRVAMETVWFEDMKPTADYCVLVAMAEGDPRLRAIPECILELNRQAARLGYLYIMMSRLSNSELQKGSFSPTFPGSGYPKPLLEPPRHLRKARVWRP